MADYKNIPLGLRTQTQIPLDVKEYIQNESLLSNLGVNGQLAYTYTKGLVVYCIEESTRWEWIEVKPGLEDTGLINQDFIYPDNHVAFGIDYSNKRYNFFPYNQSTFTVPDATTTIKGILKLTNDLGGTADIPTTPTAVHKTGDESFTGIKSVINNGSSLINGLFLTNDGTNTDGVLKIINNNSGIGFYANVVNGSGLKLDLANSSKGIEIYNSSNNLGMYIAQSGAGFGLRIANFSTTFGSNMEFIAPTVGNGDLIQFKSGNSGNPILSKIDKNGRFIILGGTSTQMLMADGSVKENQDNLQKVITTSTVILDIDNNNTIFINNGATPITITINSSITIPNFCVGFVQEGTGDVTFVGSEVSLTNPVGLKSKGQGYQTFIERKLNTSTFYLLGNTKN